jgi:hypothetical protein
VSDCPLAPAWPASASCSAEGRPCFPKPQQTWLQVKALPYIGSSSGFLSAVDGLWKRARKSARAAGVSPANVWTKQGFPRTRPSIQPRNNRVG